MPQIPSPKPNETAAETWERQMAEYPHNHAAGDGEPFISRSVTQDATETPCPDCGRRTSGRAYVHGLNCPNYQPHPDSIAAHPEYAPTH
jgi:hypothetical protein